MHKLKAKAIVFASTVLMAVTAIMPFRTFAAEVPAPTGTFGDWNVTTVSVSGPDWHAESYKVDRGLVAWTEVDSTDTRRRLYAFDGVNTRLLADMAKTDWSDDADYAFVEPVTGDYDVADGLVVWVMNDGNDREIYSFDGQSVKKVSDNSYDDRHPVTGGGRIAWTSTPSGGSAYNLMIKDGSGVHKLASWQVLNYAFSGGTLYWLNQLPNENWFRVFRDDGTTRAVGQGDDRPIRNYFYVDGKGTAAWEYSTKQWSYDKRRVYVSPNGGDSMQEIQRDVPPNVTRVEDVDSNGHVILNVTDLLLSDLNHNVSLIDVLPGVETTIFRKDAPSKVRFMDGGYVRQREPNVNTGLVFHAPTHEDFITLDPIIKERFDADGSAAAGAKVGGGVVLYANGKTDVAPSTAEAQSITVKNGDVAWMEGTGGSAVIKYAAQTVLVKSVGVVKTTSGMLVKTAGNPAVYLASQDGKRYVFPNEGEFYTWYPGFGSVRTISALSLADMPLGGDVLYRPGSRLLKEAASTSVYAVGKDGAIHWIADEGVAVAVFGADWKSKVDVVDDTILADYSLGQPITTDYAYFAALSGK